jgi:hypothetical protein
MQNPTDAGGHNWNFVVDASFVEVGQNGLGDPFALKRLEAAF